jgi:RNA polymerase sigma-70 factor (ECF subfamily)
VPRPDEAVERAFREHFGRAVAALIRAVGDWDVAEEAVQDAFATALQRWPRDGVPRDPLAWIVAVARNRAIDRLRRERALRALAPELAPEPDEVPVGGHRYTSVPDERLRLIFTCCHPALAVEAQVALTLRLLGGLTTAEVAHAFLVPEPTMAQRLARAKAKIRTARIPFRVPPDAKLPERLDAVLDVVSLVFNEGYAASGGEDHIRVDLCAEALRLAALLTELRRSGCARCCSRTTPAATRASTTPARWSSSTIRTAHAGTTRRSSGPCGWPPAHCGSARPAATRFRPRSPSST